MSLPTSAVASTSTQHAVSSDVKRPCVTYAPCIWGDTFLQYAYQSMEVNDNVMPQARILKEEVKMTIQSSNTNIMEKLNIIDFIQRFGISYHFQKEINQTLEQIHDTFTNNTIISDDRNHHSISLLFRLLRQQRYQISSSVFNELKNDQGIFNESLASNIQGLCNLYEASYLRTPKDDILEEVCDFANTQLKSLANQQLSPSLTAQINYCLRRPLNKNVPRFDARFHMNLYEQDPSHNETLLTFAKVDFNILQKLHQKEISIVTKWWKKSNIQAKVPYARNRLVEAYLWALSLSYEPDHSNERMFVTKLIVVVSLLDDTYDAYATFQELELFTQAIQRWDITLIGSLPHCMKEVFDSVLDLCDEIELATTENGKSILAVSYFKQAVINLTKGYMVEAKWCHEGYVPTYDEYKVNGILTSCFTPFITMFTCVGNFATENVFNWIFSDTKIIETASIIGRVLDDMATHEFEQQRVHVASAVECCMKQYDISQVEAYNFIHNDVEDYWKIINAEYLKTKDIPKSVLDCVVNLTRMCEVSYENHQDKYTNGEQVKDYVSSLLLEPMCLDQQ